MRTAGSFNQDTAFTDGQIFLGPNGDFSAIGGTAPTLATGGAGLIYFSCATAASTYNLFSMLSQLLRTGTQINYQEQFGTTGPPPVAGPTSVANTSDPLALQGFPPLKIAALPPIKGPVTGYLPKGIQVNSVDVIYSVAGAALTAATIGLTATKFVNNTAPAVSNLIALANNGLPTATQAQPYVTNDAVPTPAFTVTTDTELILNINLTTGAGGSAIFYGAVLKCSFNFN